MALNKILRKISTIALSHSLSIVQTKSDSGNRKAQRRGPYLFNFEVTMPPMYDDSGEYYDIQSELQAINYGVTTITTQMPTLEVRNRGLWSGTPLVDLASQTGTTVNLKGFSSNVTDIVKAGDWVQFPGDTKVYQVTEDASSDGTGKLSIKLNTPLIKSPANSAVIVTGNAVEFRLALISYGDPVKTPANNQHNFAQWGAFIFEEVL